VVAAWAYAKTKKAMERMIPNRKPYIVEGVVGVVGVVERGKRGDQLKGHMGGK